MKMAKMTVFALALIGLLAANNALAAGSTQVNVSATVQGTCSFDAATYNMDFGTINVTDTGDKTATATLDFTCTNNTAYTIDNVSGSRNMVGPAAEALPYTIAAYATNGTATGALQSVPLNGTIAQADYQAASAGTYTETITVNINP